MFRFFVGIDLGQAADYSAIVAIERREIIEPQGVSLEEHDPVLRASLMVVSIFEVRHLERLPLGTPYPGVVERIRRILHAPELIDNTVCVVDMTGCGRPVFDMMRSEGLPQLVGITITGGHEVTQTAEGFHVPKKELVSALQLYLQAGRLKIAYALPDADLLRDEILNFRAKISLRTGEETYEAWREGVHDDMVLATALPLWYATRYETKRPLFDSEGQSDETYDVLRFGL